MDPPADEPQSGMESAQKDHLPPFHNAPTSAPFPITGPAYLHYAPGVAPLRKSQNYSNYFNALGFGPEGFTSNIRKAFVNAMKHHVDDNQHRFLRMHQNRAAYNAMVREFLTEHGKTYWGSSHRDHLKEKNVFKGFWYPRDAERENSRLVEVMEQMFDYIAMYRTNGDMKKAKEKQQAIHINHEGLTGLKADAPKLETVMLPKRPILDHPVGLARVQPAGSRRRKRHDSSSDSDLTYHGYGSSRNFHDETNTQTSLRPLPDRARWSRRTSEGDYNQIKNHATSASQKPFHPRPGASVVDLSAEPHSKANESKKSKGTHPPNSNRHRETESDSDAALASRTLQDYDIIPPTTRTPSKASLHKESATISLDSSPEREQQKTRNPNSENRASGLNSTTQKKPARVKDEPLSSDITDRTVLRVKADGSGVKARGPIEVDFQVYKTSERLFTSLMSERSLKPEMQKKVSQLTVTVNGKETCCRRTHLDDWTKVCRELRKLWDNKPELFDDRFEIDVMLHVDE